MAKLIEIATREYKRGPMAIMKSAHVSIESGVADDFRGKQGKRQVTVLNSKSWSQACDQVGKNLHWTTRRANLLIDDFELKNSTGKFLTISDLVLEITQETDPCNRMEESVSGLFEALRNDWRGGVCCRVIRSGYIHAGDEVKIVTKCEYESRK